MLEQFIIGVICNHGLFILICVAIVVDFAIFHILFLVFSILCSSGVHQKGFCYQVLHYNFISLDLLLSLGLDSL